MRKLPPEAWTKLEYRILNLYHHPVSESTRHLVSAIPHYVCWRLDAGSRRRRPRGRPALEVEAGHWVLIPPDVAREHFFSSDAVLMSFHAWIGWPGHRPLVPLPEILVRPRAAWPELDALCPAVREHFGHKRQVDATAFAAGERVRWAWLETFCRTLEREGYAPAPWALRDARLARGLEVLEGLNHVTRLPYARLREASGLSRVHLDRLFVAHLGKTPRQVLDGILFRRATELLVAGDTPLKSIAAALAFPSPAHFNRWFKRIAGQTPGAYRRRLS